LATPLGTAPELSDPRPAYATMMQTVC